MMHKTATVDYAIVLDGEICAVMDVGETVMTTGDVLIQRGTNHSWAIAATSRAASPSSSSPRRPFKGWNRAPASC